MYNLLYLLAIYLPFQLAINPSSGIDLASIRVVIIGLVLAWLAIGLKKRNIVLPGNMTSGLIITFLFLSTLSIIVSKNIDWSIRKILFLFSIIPLYFVASNILVTRDRIIAISKALVGSAAAVALVGIFQFVAQFIWGIPAVYKLWAYLISPPFLGKNVTEAVLANPSWLVNISGRTVLRATATFPDPHMFSFFLGLSAPLALGIFFASRRFIYLICFFILLVANLFTFSRGGYLALFAGAVTLVILLWKQMHFRVRVAIFIAASGIFALLLYPGPISNRFQSSFNLKEGSNQGRLEMFAKAIEIAERQPVLGVGIGNFPLEVKDLADYREPIYAHNAYLDIASETGILNALVFLALLMVTAWRLLKKTKESYLFPLSAVSLLIFSAHSLFETAIYSPVVLALLMLILSFGNNKRSSSKYAIEKAI